MCNKDANYKCMDCGVDTSVIDEYYMVQHELWKSVAERDGMLCIGCLEKRLDRKLTPNDFIDALVNRGYFTQSRRLLERLYPELEEATSES